MTDTRVTALIMAAGSGERMGGEEPKQYRKLAGVPVLRRAVMPFADHPRVDRVRVVVAPGCEEQAHRALGGLFDDPQLIVGGPSRGESVSQGLKAIDGDVVLIHDAARPFCPADVIDRLLSALESSPGAVPTLPVNDTLARGTEFLGETIDREGAVRVQTPQAFRLADIRAAYEQWQGPFPSDDSAVAKAAGLGVTAVAGAFELDKLTTADDWARAEALIGSRTVTRSGIGFDAHAFAGEGPVMLGGIAIPHARGLAGHSDADVALHAITDALLGALGEGDIGHFFPNTDPRWLGAASKIFLVEAARQVGFRQGRIINIDATVLAQQPKIAPHIHAMKIHIGEALGLNINRVGLKATTNELLGFIGREEGIAAMAVASVELPD